ncbi:MAG TPA: FAD-dependent oxidoreductase, partial [Flavisolibacter sp.]|nr:FAD-dependent oxidoreductase [Flavisolibacter sp.]
MEQELFDVIIIGAGAAGLMVAWELVQTGKKVLVLEARNRTGGRIHTIIDPNFEIPVEMGAEFIHGNLDLTLMLAKKAGIKYYKLSGEAWRKENGKLEKQGDFIADYNDLD